jgi:glycerol uptake facilitator-like aquaporin
MSFDLPRRIAAEALGTGLLVAAVVGSGIMADALTDDRAVALLCNTVATGAVLVVLMATLGPVSGRTSTPRSVSSSRCGGSSPGPAPPPTPPRRSVAA